MELLDEHVKTYLPLVPHICVSESGQHWFRLWRVACSVPSHYLNQCLVIVNWTLRNKLQWIFNQNLINFIHENASENIVCEMAAILSRGRWVNKILYGFSSEERGALVDRTNVTRWIAIYCEWEMLATSSNRDSNRGVSCIHSPADWMPTGRYRESLYENELNSPSLWWPCFSPFNSTVGIGSPLALAEKSDFEWKGDMTPSCVTGIRT